MGILSGFKKYKKYKKTSKGYQLQSQWTSAQSVEMGDGNTAETNLGAIQGITDSLTATSSNIALSANAGKNLQDQVTALNSNLNTGIADIKIFYGEITGISENTTVSKSITISDSSINTNDYVVILVPVIASTNLFNIVLKRIENYTITFNVTTGSGWLKDYVAQIYAVCIKKNDYL